MTRFTQVLREAAHQRFRHYQQLFIGRVRTGQLEQLQRERVSAAAGLAPQVTAAFQTGEHAKDLAGLPVQGPRKLCLRHWHCLVRQVLQHVERLFQRRHGVLRATLLEIAKLFLGHTASLMMGESGMG
jgi:hypothetical protein